MKKVTKTLVALGCVAALSAGVCAMAACGESGTKGEAYGLSHGAGYVAYSAITVSGEKITKVTLTEVCLPTNVTADESVAATDKVTVTVTDHGNEVEKSYYKTISFGGATFTYDATDKAYKKDSQTIVEYLQTEANAKAYYEAVIGNKLTVKIGDKDKTGIMTKKNLSKEENGYWTVSPKEGETFKAYSQWKWNRDATVAYVKANGVSGLANLAKASENNVTLPNGAEKAAWVDSKGVSTGATWSDMWKAEAPANYLTYAQLLTKAYNAATK